MKRNKKTFILGIGAMKAGTTWLFDYLDNYKCIACSPLKEIHYFDVLYRNDLFGRRLRKNWKVLQEKIKNTNYLEGLKNEEIFANIERLYMHAHSSGYLEHFDRISSSDTTHVCEITPSYALLPLHGYREIKNLLEARNYSVKIIFLLRDPIDRHWSQIRFDSRKKKGADLDQYSETLSNPHWIERGRYDLTYDKITQVFGKESVYIGFYEKLFSERSILELYDFLNITESYITPKFDKIVGKTKEISERPVGFDSAAYNVYRDVYQWAENKFKNELPSNWYSLQK